MTVWLAMALDLIDHVMNPNQMIQLDDVESPSHGCFICIYSSA